MRETKPTLSAISAKNPAVPAYCVGLMESAWLAAAILVPLFFNPHAVACFQPNKVVLLRVLALICLAAAATRWVLQNSSVIGRFRPRFLLPGTALGVALSVWVLGYLLATLFSINRAASLWGSDEQMEGTMTFLSALVLFGCVATHLKTPAQIERLVTTILVASFPMALYAIMQGVGLDPRSTGERLERVLSMSGNAIYLAEYLELVIPLTLWRLVRLAVRLKDSGGHDKLVLAAMGFYLVLAGVQLVAFFWTGSRGAFLGLATGSVFLALVWACHGRRWRLLKLELATVALALSVFLVLNQAHDFLAKLPNDTELARFSSTLPLSGVEDLRTELWKRAPAIMLAREPLPYPTGGSDAFHFLRPYLGYGPETVENVLPRWWIFPADANTSTGLQFRFHNLGWDLWFGLGAFGLIGFVSFLQALFYLAYQRLGFVPVWFAGWRFAAFPTVAGFAVALVLASHYGIGFVGLGGVVGLAAGLGSFPLITGLTGRAVPAADATTSASDGLIIAILAALLGHLIALAFAFSVAATLTLFWLYAGVTVALCRGAGLAVSPGNTEESPPARRASSPRSKKSAKATGESGPKPAMVGAFVAALVLLSLLFGFISQYSTDTDGAGEILTMTLTQIHSNQGSSYLLPILIIPTWVAACFALNADACLWRDIRHWAGAFGISLLLSGCIAGAYAWLKAGQISAIGPMPDPGASADAVLAQNGGYEMLYFTVMGILTVVVLLGGTLFSSPMSFPAFFSSRALPVLMAVLVTALIAAWFTSANRVSSSVTAQWGAALTAFGRPGEAADVYRHMVVEDPSDASKRIVFADSLQKLAPHAPAGESCDDVMREAEATLLAAQKLHGGLDPSSYNLGRLYLSWAAAESNAGARLSLAEKAGQAFDQALIFQPGYAPVWADRAILNRLFLNQPAEAERCLNKSLDLVRGPSQADWGDFYQDRSLSAQSDEISRQYAQLAVACYDENNLRKLADKSQAAHYLAGLGNMYITLEKPDQALPCYLAALEFLPDGVAWRIEAITATIYHGKGDLAEATNHLDHAINTAPPDQRASLVAMRNQWVPR